MTYMWICTINRFRYCECDYTVNKIHLLKKILRYLRPIELPKSILTDKFNRPDLNLLLSSGISEVDKKLQSYTYMDECNTLDFFIIYTYNNKDPALSGWSEFK